MRHIILLIVTLLSLGATAYEALSDAYENQTPAPGSTNILLTSLLERNNSQITLKQTLKVICTYPKAQEDFRIILRELAAIKKSPNSPSTLNKSRLKKLNFIPELVARQILDVLIESRSPLLWMDGATVLSDLKTLADETRPNAYENFIYDFMMERLDVHYSYELRIFAAFMLIRFKEIGFYSAKINATSLGKTFEGLQYDEQAGMRSLADYALNSTGSFPFMLLSCVSLSTKAPKLQ